MNILICSVGRRVQLIEYFKKELAKVNGNVIAVDCDRTAPALYHANSFEIVPRIVDPDYINQLKNICQKYNVKGILSLIDPELTLLASFKEEFEKEGIKVIVSDKNVVDLCFDKYLTYKFLEISNLPFVPTYLGLEKVNQDITSGKIKFPLIVKPKEGSAGIGVQKITDIDELEAFLQNNHNYIVQPFIDGSEYCVECYIDLETQKITSLFSKRKFNMRSGETDKSISVKDPVLNEIVEKLVDTLKPLGPVDIDFFKTDKGYLISEINPRFGGGYPYAYEMGHNFIEKIINNLKGVQNPGYIKYQGVYEEGETMVRYDHFTILKRDPVDMII